MNLRDPKVALMFTGICLLGAFVDALFFSHTTDYNHASTIGKMFWILTGIGILWLVLGQFLFRKK